MKGRYVDIVNSFAVTLKARPGAASAVAQSVENDLVKMGLPRGRAVGLVRKALYGVARNPRARGWRRKSGRGVRPAGS